MVKNINEYKGRICDMYNERRELIVAIPCYNEAPTISKVIRDFKRDLPEARIIVFDNMSTDDSFQLAKKEGADVEIVRRRGKGAVIRQIFRETDADIYLIVDGDDACPASVALELISPIMNDGMDMVIGDRFLGGSYEKINKRRFHSFGNRLVCWLVNKCFTADLGDVMCGYRAFSRRFAKNVPVLSDGFQVETELTIRCLDRKLPFAAVPIAYKDRPEGSFSKLRTFRDGLKVLCLIFSILKDYRPLFFFGMLSFVFFVLGLFFGIPVLREYFKFHSVTIASSAVLATGLMLISAIMLICALILDTMVSHERQRNELHLLQFGGMNGCKIDSDNIV
jgi:glycosyltransferase involved in cell wall biosynthesis